MFIVTAIVQHNYNLYNIYFTYSYNKDSKMINESNCRLEYM